MESKKILPFAASYVRGGMYADLTASEINQRFGLPEDMLVLKYHPGTDVDRRIIARFDISDLEGKYVRLMVNSTASIAEPNVCYAARLTDFTGDLSSLTWNTFPEMGDEIDRDLFAGFNGCDVSDLVREAKATGKTELCLAICATKTCDIEIRMTNPAVSGDAIRLEEFDAVPEVYTRVLTGDEERDNEIWAWAEARYDEWYARYLELTAEPELEAELIQSPAEQYTESVWFSSSSKTFADAKHEAPTRTVAALTDLDKYAPKKDYPVDNFGGLMDESLRGEATGFFYVKKVGDRFRVFDPLGYPFVVRALSGVVPGYQGSVYQKQKALEKYGSFEEWGEQTTRRLKNHLGFYAAAFVDPYAYQVKDPLANQTSIGFAYSYGRTIGTANSKGGSSTFSENNTMNVFDPAFVEYADKQAQNAEKHKDDPYILGYTTDNELPMQASMLLSYLSLDPKKPVNHYSYACAWTWIRKMMNCDALDARCIDDELYELFRGFVWDRYYYVVSTAMRRYDPNHMLLGTRFLTNVRSAKWVLKFAGKYLDCMTINWYGTWQPQAESIYLIAKSANCPFMITEFYTKAGDSGLGNTSGAGQYVETQRDRGMFYQNYTLRLLEAKNCVGWHWFQYIDNDPRNAIMPDGRIRDVSSTDSNKGIISNEHEEYTECTKYMAEINNNVYRLIDYFDNKYKK